MARTEIYKCNTPTLCHDYGCSGFCMHRWEITEWPLVKFNGRATTRAFVQKPRTSADLCVDEGCPQFGTPHICINSVELQTITIFPPDVAEYKDHCQSCMRGPITLARMGHALTCVNRGDGA